MDPVTHGLIGATASQSFADSEKLRAAGLTGFIAAMIADLDVLISDPGDPLLNLEMHRQITHSFVFIPVGALIASILAWPFFKKYLSFKEIYLYSFVAYATAGIADIFTSYGVQLLWPFTDERYALNIISVFDPVFTLGILVLSGLAFYKWQKVLSWLAWCWIAVYLMFGYGQRERAENIALQITTHFNHLNQRMVVKPTIGNQLLWSVRYETLDSLYAYGVRISPFSKTIIYNGETASLLDWQNKYAKYKGTRLYEDIRRFSNLSEGFLIKHPDRDQVIGDGRYAMLPTSLSPLWGIEIDTTRPHQHVAFNTYRDAAPEVRKSFLNMLFGRRIR